MKRELGILKKEMALRGYYTCTDFSKLISISKQAVSKQTSKYQTIQAYNRTWYKYDNGKKGKELHPEQNQFFESFLKFGFKKRHNNLAFKPDALVDVKRISPKIVNISIHNELGDVLNFNINQSEIELITDD